MDYTTLGKDVFASITRSQKSVCVIVNEKLACFNNNNYEAEVNHIKNVFGAENCSIGSDDIHCRQGSIQCRFENTGTVACGNSSTIDSCVLSEQDVAICYDISSGV